MKLSKNFNLDEFTFSRTAVRMGIDNTPTDEAVENIIALVKNVLQPLRDQLDVPLIITSGYRSPELNKAIGGVSDSQHTKGQAVDFIAPPYGIDEIFDLIIREYPFDQAINEFDSWVHLSYCENNRYERYKAYLKDGKTVYIPIK